MQAQQQICRGENYSPLEGTTEGVDQVVFGEDVEPAVARQRDASSTGLIMARTGRHVRRSNREELSRIATSGKDWAAAATTGGITPTQARAIPKAL